MTTTLIVVSDDELVGILTRTGSTITFSYDDDWRSRRDATPLSVSMPLTASVHSPRVVEPWLWGLLPDNEQVLARWAREFHTSSRHPFGLLAAVGEDLPGAFRIITEDRAAGVDRDGGVEWLSEAQVAGLLRDVRADQTAWLGAQAEGRWSLAGAQAKIALRHDGTRWGRPHGRAATTHILKPAIATLDDHDLNEHLCLRAGRLLGLRTVRSSIVSFEQERAIAIERYDRLPGLSGQPERVHQEDLCQALAVHPERKYEAEGGPSVADVAAVLRGHIPGKAGHAAREAFADALAFNWLIGAPDAHAKNYSLLLSGSQVRLAPLYDIASALAYEEFYEPKLKLAMKIGGQYLVSGIGRDHWMNAAAQIHLDGEQLVARVCELAMKIPDAFAAACSEPAVIELDSLLPQRLLSRVADRAARCAARL